MRLAAQFSHPKRVALMLEGDMFSLCFAFNQFVYWIPELMGKRWQIIKLCTDISTVSAQKPFPSGFIDRTSGRAGARAVVCSS